MAPHTRVGPSYQSLIKEMSYWLAYNPSLWGHFLNQGSLLSSDSGLHRVDIKLTTTLHVRTPTCHHEARDQGEERGGGRPHVESEKIENKKNKLAKIRLELIGVAKVGTQVSRESADNLWLIIAPKCTPWGRGLIRYSGGRLEACSFLKV